MDEGTRQLALEIARCPVIAAVLAGTASPCSDVVNFQNRDARNRWLAEPWSGHLERAPILFLSSNPNSGEPDEAIKAGDLVTSSDDEEILHSFDDAFEAGPWIGIYEGTHLRSADGAIGKHVAYWASCKRRASELLGRPAVPGCDYALTEVVHCGSQHEIGVRTAGAECVPRYLDRVMSVSPARVVVVVGSVARDIVRSTLPALSGDGGYMGPTEWSGRSRHVLFLPHPNARGVPKGVEAYLGGATGFDIRTIRDCLTAKS